MELPSDYFYFWHTQVLPGKPCIIEIPKEAECSITNVALHQTPNEVIPPETRSILFISVNNSDPVAITPFLGGQLESTIVDLRFSEGDKIVLTIQGNFAADIIGHYSGLELKIDNGAPPPPVEIIQQGVETIVQIQEVAPNDNEN